MVEQGCINDSKEQGELFSSVIKLNKCKFIIEVGVMWGTTTMHLCKGAIDNNGFVFGYDKWGRHGKFNQFPQIGSQQNAEEYIKSCGFNNFKLFNVDTYTTFFDDLLRGQFSKQKIDFAFIDADHSYDGIKNDFFKVYPYMSNTGIIAFHDTLRIDGCREFIIDLRTIYNDGTFDIIDFPWGNQSRRVGITLLVKRSYATENLTIDEVCGSVSTPEIIYEKEKIWLSKEIKRYKK